MASKVRLALASVVASAALLGSSFAAPIAHAEPTSEAQAAKTALDNIKPTDAAGVIDGIEAANTLLKKLGITPFTPTLGACTDFTLAPALGGAMPGPTTPLIGDLTLFGLDLNAVKKGEILYGFVPVGVFNDSGNKGGMQVAWFNVNTFQGSLGTPMKGFAETVTDAVLKRIDDAVPGDGPIGGTTKAVVKAAAKTALEPVLNIVPSNGVRGGLVDTGSGTVLSAIYGTVKKGDATCFFFPSLGIATAK